jgi:methyl-accepting chemotaxis protein
MMGIEGDAASTSVGVLVALWAAKVITYMSIIAARLRPLARWFAGTKPPTDPRTIKEIAAVAYRAPFTIATTYSVLYASTYVLNLLVLYVAFADSVPLGPESLEASVFASIGLLLGAVNVTFPLAEWLMAPTIESISLTAHEQKVPLRGRGLTFRARLVVFALTLALAPSLFLAAITYMNDARAEQRLMGVRAELALSEIAHGRSAEELLPEGLVFTFDADATVTGREAARALAERPELARLFRQATAAAPAGTVSHVRHGIVAFRTDAGRTLGVVIPNPGSVSFSTLLLIILFLLIVLSWAPGCAMFISNSTAVPVLRISEALARVSEGEVSSAPRAPVFHQDELGALARNYNVMIDQLRLLSLRTTEVSKGALDVELDVRGDLGEAFRGQVTNLRDIVGHIAQNATQLASAASEMYAAAQEQEVAAQQQSIGVEEISRTMESLLIAATHVTESTMGVLTRAERTRETTARTAERITELSAHASRIGEILEEIR